MNCHQIHFESKSLNEKKKVRSKIKETKMAKVVWIVETSNMSRRNEWSQKKYVAVKVSTFHLISGIFASLYQNFSISIWIWVDVRMCAICYFDGIPRRTHKRQNERHKTEQQKKITTDKHTHRKTLNLLWWKRREKKKCIKQQLNIYAVFMCVCVCESVCFFSSSINKNLRRQ